LCYFFFSRRDHYLSGSGHILEERKGTLEKREMRRALNTSNSVKAAGQIRHNLHTAGGRDKRAAAVAYPLLLQMFRRASQGERERERENTYRPPPESSSERQIPQLVTGKKKKKRL